MSRPKLLKPPARRLLLTFVVTAGVAVAIKAAPARTSLGPVQAQRATATAKSRARQLVGGMDSYTYLHGVPRWGINE